MQDQKLTRWVTINLDALAHNYSVVANATEASICCVVKANAYGHGAISVSRLFADLGARFLAVATIEEALELREAEISTPILVLGYTPPAFVPYLAEHKIVQSVYSLSYAQQLQAVASAHGVQLLCHVKFDTGMGRLGFCVQDNLTEGVAEALAAAQLSHLVVSGIYTHFAAADSPDEHQSYTQRQLEDFLDASTSLQASGVDNLLRHSANSAAVFSHPASHLDMVRAGIVLYGYTPVTDCKVDLNLRPAMTLKGVVVATRTVEKETSIGYGRTFVTPRTMRVAIIRVGYADGLRRASGPGWAVTSAGEQAPIIGRVCMDHIMVDVSEIGCEVGDTATIFGGGGVNSIAAYARFQGTIPYEVCCAVGSRVPRIYIADR